MQAKLALCLLIWQNIDTFSGYLRTHKLAERTCFNFWHTAAYTLFAVTLSSVLPHRRSRSLHSSFTLLHAFVQQWQPQVCCPAWLDALRLAHQAGIGPSAPSWPRKGCLAGGQHLRGGQHRASCGSTLGCLGQQTAAFHRRAEPGEGREVRPHFYYVVS